MKDLQLKNINQILHLIDKENKAQVAKRGIQEHTSIEWGSIVSEEQGELIKAINEFHFNEVNSELHAFGVIKEAIRTATLSMKIAEMFIIFIENCNEPKESDEK